jgi:hypothetical protein
MIIGWKRKERRTGVSNMTLGSGDGRSVVRLLGHKVHDENTGMAMRSGADVLKSLGFIFSSAVFFLISSFFFSINLSKISVSHTCTSTLPSPSPCVLTFVTSAPFRAKA